MTVVSEVDRRAFDRDGFVVMRGVVDAGMCGQIQRDVSVWARRHAEAGARLQDAWRTSPAVRQLATHPAVLSALADLYGRHPIPFQTLNFARGTEQPLHADSVHFDSVPHGWMCGVWVALEDVGLDQGPLSVVPGSHRLQTTSFQRAFDDRGRFDMAAYEQELAAEVAESPREDLALGTGDTVIWHADLVHGGAAMRDGCSTRYSQVTHYFFEGVTYVTPLRCDPAGGAVHLRFPLDIAGLGRLCRRTTAGDLVPRHRLDGTTELVRTGQRRAGILHRSTSAVVGTAVRFRRGVIPSMAARASIWGSARNKREPVRAAKPLAAAVDNQEGGGPDASTR